MRRAVSDPSPLVTPSRSLLLGGAGVLAYNYNQPFRHTVLAVVRCSRIAGTPHLSVLARLWGDLTDPGMLL